MRTFDKTLLIGAGISVTYALSCAIRFQRDHKDLYDAARGQEDAVVFSHSSCGGERASVAVWVTPTELIIRSVE